MATAPTNNTATKAIGLSLKNLKKLQFKNGPKQPGKFQRTIIFRCLWILLGLVEFIYQFSKYTWSKQKDRTTDSQKRYAHWNPIIILFGQGRHLHKILPLYGAASENISFRSFHDVFVNFTEALLVSTVET